MLPRGPLTHEHSVSRTVIMPLRKGRFIPKKTAEPMLTPDKRHSEKRVLEPEVNVRLTFYVKVPVALGAGEGQRWNSRITSRYALS